MHIQTLFLDWHKLDRRCFAQMLLSVDGKAVPTKRQQALIVFTKMSYDVVLMKCAGRSRHFVSTVHRSLSNLIIYLKHISHHILIRGLFFDELSSSSFKCLIILLSITVYFLDSSL